MTYQPTGKPRGRPKRPKPEDMRPIDASMLPATDSAGKTKDLAYFIRLVEEGREKYMRAVLEGSDQVPNLRAYNEMLVSEAELYGYSLKSLIDRRSDMDKAVEAVDRLEEFTRANRSILEMWDGEIDAVEKLQVRCVELSAEAEGNAVRKQFGEALVKWDEERRAAVEALGKAWGERLARLRRVKELAREPLPQSLKTLWNAPSTLPTSRSEFVVRASHTLRHAAYVIRTNLSARQKSGGTTSLLDFKDHHARISMGLYMMDHDLMVSPQGMVPLHEGMTYEGIVVKMPPGIGKTTLAVAYFVLDIARNNYLKLLAGHAVEDKASDNLKYTASFFKQDNPGGRRFAALWGGLACETDNSYEFRLSLREKSKAPTMRAHGIRARISGADADKIWFDDPVDPSERYQSEERARTRRAIADNWLPRLRGKSAKHITTATVWHEDDFVNTLIVLNRQDKKMLVEVTARCGGPDERFESLWPEEYPPAKLKSIWESDPVTYSAAYMGDPRSESQQIVRRLRYYDPSSPQHVEFMRGAYFYVSVDPAVTGRKGADKAGIIYAALGEVEGAGENGETVRERRLRIVEAHEILATMSDLKQHLVAFCTSRSVHYVAVETNGAGAVLPDMLYNEYKVDSILCPTGNKNKETRLRAVGMLIDHHRAGVNENASGIRLPGAVVEFPGVMMIGKQTPQPDPNLGWYYDEFLRFGVTSRDHAMDATCQLVAHLVRAGELQVGAGWVTDRLVRNAEEKGDPRIKDWVRRVKNQGRPGMTDETEDWADLAEHEYGY